MLRLIRVITLSIIMVMVTSCAQLSDNSYKPKIQNPAYSKGEGTTVLIDEGHYNFHTMSGGYRPFADVLKLDGYVVEPYDSEFSSDTLVQVEILVIANALNRKNVGNWTLPCPSAFTDSEIRAVVDWVMQGGSLFLIADHMPFGGAASGLAKAFGFKFTNGFAMKKTERGPSSFSVSHRTLVESIVTRGRSEFERVTDVSTFTGQAFLTPRGAHPILVFDDDHINLFPERAWKFSNNTKTMETKGWCQGAYMKFGQGRIVVFGEAAMFRIQTAGRNNLKAGMSADPVRQNYKLLLNLIHWLDGLLDEEITTRN